MTCEEIEHNLLESHGRELSPEMKEHIASCQSCRTFAKVLALTASTADATAFEPSMKLDASVMMACIAEMRRQQRMRLLWKTVRIAAVACVVVLLAWQMLSLTRIEKPARGGNPIVSLQSDDSPDAADDVLISMVMADKLCRDWEADVDLAWMKSLTPAPEATGKAVEVADAPSDSPLGELNNDMLDVELILMDNMR